MKMDRKFVLRRRAVAIVIGSLLLSLFTYATRDLCWTGSGYGSCSAIIDEVIENGR
jgi:hypothetical protein